ncbi:MAG: hypothetical protein NC347_04405 [Clostridium sp.]|nr:hypothetical protein [Clostridium sp.]
MKMKKIFAILLVFVLVLGSTSHYNAMESVQAASVESNSIEEPQELEEVTYFEGEERLYRQNNEAIKQDETGLEIESELGKARSASNDNPNGAYYLPFNAPQSDNIDMEGEGRWWGVISEETSRISTMMVAEDNTVDFDLYVYRLNEETSTLELVGYSIEDAGAYEIVDMVVDAGTYYIKIASNSGTGNFALVSYLSTQYIANEINDNVTCATALPDSATITDAIDSPIDMDVYKFTVSTQAARKKFVLTCPNGCNYAMYMVRESTGKAYNVTNRALYLLESDTYYLVIATADDTYSDSLPYTLAVTSQGCALNATDLLSYDGYLLQQGGTGLDYYINGKKIDFSYQYKDNFSSGSNYMNARMTLSTRSTSEVFNTAFTDTDGIDHAGIMFIKYNSSFNGSTRKIALYIPINDVNYAYDRTASASMAPTSVHQSGRVFAEVIVDVDTGKTIDLFSPNWYYESSSSHHYHSIGDIYAICTDND